MMQTKVNIRHFKNLGWDVMIQSDYAPLLVMAHDELKFWVHFAVEGNKKAFFPPPPEWILWSDASDKGVGALVAKLGNCKLGSFVHTANNLLMTLAGKLPHLRSCASLQADALPWAGLQDVLIRDKRDLNPSNCTEFNICFRGLDFAEQAKDSKKGS